ncbi:cupin domain-containing protein [Flavisphingomonas formosensis]|uniref:cupin domain-containing protein n=1 Tax=Flavisphingomonas formosensis TaxID=861534 RepID=UPI0012F8ADF9|nr:cupin domain-containing protein [Sphingomonas formosensis]
MNIRRVVSGQDGNGRSIIVSDERIEISSHGSMGGASLWSADALPRFPIDGRQSPFTTLFPGPGGYRFSIMVLHPEDAAGSGKDTPEAAARARQFHDIVEGDADKPGMHTTDTVDFEVVLSGEASMELDDDIHVHLKAGDTFVQNGTRHRWYNRGTEDAVVAVFMLGGEPRR